MDCFASLAMTIPKQPAVVIARSACDEAIHLSRSHHGLLRFARNDGGKASDTRLNPAAHRARVVQEIPALFEQRAQGMPGARCAR
jgi:hypothetical protein